MFKLIPADMGRPITDINLPLEIPSLEKIVLDVFESLTPKDMELKDKQGHWWSVRIRPYKTTDHKIDGAVIALLDIDSMKTGMQRVEQARDLAESILNTVREPLLVLDKDLNVTSANHAFYRTFKLKPEDTIARRIYHLGSHQWDIPELKKLLEEILPRNSAFEDYEMAYDFPKTGKRKISLNARRMERDGVGMVLLAIQELQGT